MDSDADKTRMIRRARPAQDEVDADATRIIRDVQNMPESPNAVRIQPSSEGAKQMPQSSSAKDHDCDQTKLLRRSNQRSDQATIPGLLDDPITGWLVIISGPGKGSQLAVGEQDNRVGRGGDGESPRVSLNFGDTGIPRANAFTLRYDPKKRRFKVLPGDGANIIYLNDEDLDGPTELKAGDVIELSQTKCRFIPFCGEEFDWEDVE